MKYVRAIFSIVICLLLFSVVNVKADDYSSVSLNKLEEIKNDEAALKTVNYVRISHDDDLSLAYLISRCENLKALYISKARIDDMTFINDITLENTFELWITSGYYNMNGISNDHVHYIHIEAAYITNFSKGMNFPNLEKITIYSSSGYEDIDYSMYSKLRVLDLWCIAISNYQTFFQQLKTLSNFTNLTLRETNITDNDTKYLKTLTTVKDLNLTGSPVSDISFIEEMSQIETFRPPINVTDLSVIKKMPNLKSIYWEGYEQLALTDELVEYLDNNHINHEKYDSTLRTTILNMVNEINVTNDMTIKEKVEKVVDYLTTFVKSHKTPYDEEYSSNTLLYIVHFKAGVCAYYSFLEHAILKLMGIDSYYIGGLHPVYMREQLGDFPTEYVDDLEYELAGHAWLMAQDETGTWYGWDPVQIDQYMGQEGSEGFWIDNIYGKQMNFWKNPYEDDDYTYQQYLNGEYDTFNYYFASRHVVTNKIGYNDYMSQNEKHTVTFNSNGGSSIKSQMVKHNEKLTKPGNPTKRGYIFVEWQLNESSYDFNTKVIEDITLNAVWKKSRMTVDNVDIQPSTYIIGNYMYTRNTNSNYNGKLTTQRIMLAARTLTGDTESDMIIYYKKADGTWIDALTGVALSVPDSFEIEVTDLDNVFNSTYQEENTTVYNSDSVQNSTYIIGNYMFTRNINQNYDGKLTTKRIMLASKTLLGNTENDMIIYYKKPNGDWINALTGEALSSVTQFKIKNIDLVNQY